MNSSESDLMCGIPSLLINPQDLIGDFKLHAIPSPRWNGSIVHFFERSWLILHSRRVDFSSLNIRQHTLYYVSCLFQLGQGISCDRNHGQCCYFTRCFNLVGSMWMGTEGWHAIFLARFCSSGSQALLMKATSDSDGVVRQVSMKSINTPIQPTPE